MRIICGTNFSDLPGCGCDDGRLFGCAPLFAAGIGACGGPEPLWQSLSRLLVGSVAEKVGRHAQSPVLLCGPNGN
jgi:hypothetical protein